MLPFDTLTELTTTINRNKVKQIEVLDDAGNESKRVNKLYNGILTGKYRSDEDAARDIFGQGAGFIQYRKLRLKLFDLLTSTTFFIDTNQPKFNEQSKAYYYCYRNFAAACILHTHASHVSACYILERVLEKAIKYEFIYIVTDVIRVLRKLYSRAIFDKVKLQQIKQLSIKYEQKRQYEMEAEGVYEDLIEGFFGGRVGSKAISSEIKGKFDSFLEQSTTIDTTQFYYLTYNIGIIYALSRNDCEDALLLCNDALKILIPRKNVARGQLLPIAMNALTCCTQLKMINSRTTAEKIEQCERYSTIGTMNWIKLNEMLVHHYIYAEDYIRAISYYQKAVKSPIFQRIKGINAEIWMIYAGYFHLLVKLGTLRREDIEGIVPDIDVDFFDYDLKKLRIVKGGMNIPILMIPIYFKVIEGSFEGHGRTKESIQQYIKRHLSKAKNVRSVAMLNILMGLDNVSHKKEPTIKMIRKNLNTFQKTPIELSEQSAAIEVVPYEKLVELILAYKKIKMG